MASASRRQARVVALQTLYEVDSTGHAVAEVLQRNLEDPIYDGGGTIQSLDEAGRAFATSLVSGVLDNAEQLDRIIVQSAPNWPLDQMSPIDKGILRLAILEILFDNKVPLKAAINEAVELAKRFGSDSSSRFINGVLGTIADLSQSRGRSRPTKAKASPTTVDISQPLEARE